METTMKVARVLFDIFFQAVGTLKWWWCAWAIIVAYTVF